jgi:hypothetical protein
VTRRYEDREHSEVVGTALDLAALVKDVRGGTLPSGLPPMLELAAVVLAMLDPDELGELLQPVPSIAEAAGRCVVDEARHFLVFSLLDQAVGQRLSKGKRERSTP